MHFDRLTGAIFITLVIIFTFTSVVSGVRIYDEIKLNSFNGSYFLANETYVLEMIPIFKVPKDIVHHVIHTASEESMKSSVKRFIHANKRSLLSISSVDFQFLSEYLGETPPLLTVDHRKRTLPEDDRGRKFTKLSEEFWISYFPASISTKKRGDGPPIGTQLCAHVPFLTQCDNSPALDYLKETITKHINNTRAEIDDVRKVLDERWKALTGVLQTQNALIKDLVDLSQQPVKMLYNLSDLVNIQGAEMVNSDNILKSQLVYINNMLSSVKKYFTAIGSTDPRLVVAQPSLLELFEGYLSSLKNLTTFGKIPIVSNSTFNFQETLLPTQVVNNITSVNASYINNPLFYSGIRITAFINANFYGRIPINQPIYTKTPTTNYTFFYPAFNQTPPRNFTNGPYCLSTFGFNILADQDTTTALGNVVNLPKTMLNLTDCNIWRLKSVPNNKIYKLVMKVEDDAIPFYSNCDLNRIRNVTTYKEVNYFSNYPDFASVGILDISLNNADVNERHWVSFDCYVNVIPEWIGMQYYINQSTARNLQNIPFGFKTKHFTVNTFGELSSSLEFVSTSDWLQVYQVVRKSKNTIMVSEIDELVSYPVLFYMDNNVVIDASDSFYGEGNNGRDCIKQKTDYEEYIVNCNFQNNEKSYFPIDFLLGETRTNGIARYVNKFDFSIQKTTDRYTVTLKPKDEADFDFYIEFEGNVCPKIISRNISLTGCVFQLEYTGTNGVLFGTNSVPFTGSQANVSVAFGNYEIKSGTKNCLVISCSYDKEVTSIKLTTPDFQLISANTLNMAGKIELVQDFNRTKNSIELIQSQLNSTISEIQYYSELIGTINFTDVVTNNPFTNFSKLRAEVDALVEKMNSKNKTDDAVQENSCGRKGIFGDVLCFFDRAASTLIVIAIVVISIIVIYFVIVKTKCYKIFKKHKKGNY